MGRGDVGPGALGGAGPGARTRPGPPDASGALLRPRVVGLLARRWELRLLLVVAGAGAGKTVALAQAVAQNALAPRGRDLWLSCTPADADAGVLADGLLALFDRPMAGNHGDDPERLADVVAGALALRTPEPVCLVVDDAHRLPAGSTGAALLDHLLAGLPANAHLVVAARTEPALQAARLVATGAAARVDEEALRFDPDEQQAFAARESVDVGTVASTGGSPALAALAARSGSADVLRFLWQEVLAGIPDDRLRALAAMATVGGGDDALVRSVTGFAVADLVADVPLVERRGDGSCRLHDLWGEALAGTLTEAEVAEVRLAAAAALRARGDYDGAVSLLADADDWPAALDVVREACLASGPHVVPLPRLRSWLRRLPTEPRGAAFALLLQGLVERAADPWSPEAFRSLGEAARGLAAAGDLHGEAVAWAQLAYLSWIREDLATLTAAFERLAELADAGVKGAAAVAALGRAFVDDARGDDEAVLHALATTDLSELSDEGRARAAWLQANALWMLGRLDEAEVAAAEAARHAGPSFQTGRAAPLVAAWFAGRPDRLLPSLHGRALLASSEATERDRFLNTTFTAIAYGYLGITDAGSADLDEAAAVAEASGSARAAWLVALARAAQHVAADDEDGAAAVVAGALAAHPLADGAVERVLRRHIPLVAVLRPETAAFWADRPLGPTWAMARGLGDAFSTWRCTGDTGPLAARPWGKPGDVLAHLPLPWACEVAAATGDGELGTYLIDVTRQRGRHALRRLASAPSPVATGARHLLRALPTPPSVPLVVRVLGPIALERGGEPVVHPDWRRERVRTLLALVVARRRATRTQLADALWPDLDAESAAANLRTTLGYLQRVLEPDRDPGDAPWYVRADGDALHLVEEGLTVDAWEVEALLDRAAAAAADGVPGVELEHLVAALDRWRGEYLAGIYDDWPGPERDRLRARLLAASVRAGALLLADHDVDRALVIATRALEHEPWSEAAHRVVLAAHLARGDRASARRASARCEAALAELGVEPEEETRMLLRQVAG